MNIEPLFNLYKVKFSEMDEWKFVDNKRENVRIFVSLEMVLRKLMTPLNSNDLATSSDKNLDIVTLASCIINLAQHYKLYFAKRNKICKVYLYANIGEGKYLNREIWEGYKMRYDGAMNSNPANMYLIKIMKTVIAVVKDMIEYIGGTYLITSDKIESSVLPRVIELNTEPGVQYKNYIVTASAYDLQYVNYDYTVILAKKDKHRIVTKKNAVETLSEISRCTNKYELKPHFISFILSAIGDKERSVDNLKGIGFFNITKTIQEGIDSSIITENTNNLDLLLETLSVKVVDLVRRNYKCIDIDYQYKELSIDDITEILAQIKDRKSDEEFRRINEEYFTYCPIMDVYSHRDVGWKHHDKDDSTSSIYKSTF